jgi:hypothetical protein
MLLASAMLAAASAASTLAAGEQDSVLWRLAATVAEQDAITQADFAAISLSAVIEAYERELESIASPRRRFSAAERARQQRWAHAAGVLLEQLYVARDEVDAGSPAEVIASGPGEVQVLVGEQMLPLAAPRIARTAQFEADVVAEYCALYVCDAVFTQEVGEVAVRAAGGWSFRQGYGSTYLTRDGLGFMFDSVRDRTLKEALCVRVAEELREVLRVLKRANALGIAIDWPRLRILTGAADGSQRLVVGREGQGSQLLLPLLERVPGVLDVARPWLRGRLWDRDVEQFFPRADLLFAELLDGGGVRAQRHQ